MRISQLSQETGVPVATLKYYLRERLIPEGARQSPTQADYGDLHVRRVRVVRALIESGVSIAETRAVITALDDPPPHPFDVLAAAHSALVPRIDDAGDLAEAERLAARIGWEPGRCDDDVLRAVARALRGLDEAGFAVPPQVMGVYLDAVVRIARAEIDGVPADSVESAVHYVVLGSVLVEPLIIALRRVAEQLAAADRFGITDPPAVGAPTSAALASPGTAGT